MSHIICFYFIKLFAIITKKKEGNRVIYNATICDFLKKNGIDKNHIPKELKRTLNSPVNETILSSFLYSMYSPIEKRKIAIASIYGSSTLESFYSKNYKATLTDILSNYFDKDGDEYQNRSVSLLEYNNTEIIEQLQNSFERDPIYIVAIEEKLYISINGNHRTLLLLFHYLNTLSKYPEKEEQLKQIFQIPVRIEHLNLEFSGIQYLLKMKYGKEYQKDSITLKDDSITFLLKGEKKQMNFSEFRTFALKEISRETCTFPQIRELYQIILLNSKQDCHFKKAMNQIFKGFQKLNLEQTEKLLEHTFGYEKEIEKVQGNLSMVEYIERIEHTLFKLKIQELKSTIQKQKQLEEKLQQLNQEKISVERQLLELEHQKEEQELYQELERKIKGDNLEILILQEQHLKRQLFILKHTTFVFLRKQKIKKLEDKLKQIKNELDFGMVEQTGLTKRQALDMLSKKSEFTSTQKESLYHQLLGIKLCQKEYVKKYDELYNIRELKCFCEDCGIAFESIYQEFFLESKIHEEGENARIIFRGNEKIINRR